MSTLATEPELEIYLQRTVSPDLAVLALQSASGMVRDYCGWQISREDTTFLVDTDAITTVLDLPTMHLVDVAEVRVNGDAIAEAFVPQPIWKARGQIFWIWPRHAKVEVDVTHGYEAAPDIVRLVTLAVAARIINNPDDVKSSSVGSVSRTYETSLSALELRLLDRYRL